MATESQTKVTEKLRELRERYLDQDMQKRVSDTESALRRNIERKKLAQREEVKEIIEAAVKAIKDLSWLLANDEDLTESQRKEIFAEKRVHKFWLERLDGTRAQQAILAIEQTVDSLTTKREE
jgi:thiaminase